MSRIATIIQSSKNINLSTPTAQSRTKTKSITNNTLINNSGTISSKHIAWSGGGYNTHSILSGLFSGLLEKSGLSLQDLLASYGSVSQNSGGGWFGSQLAYSQSFVDSLSQVSSKDGIETYPYLTQTRQLFTDSSLFSPTTQAAIQTLLIGLGVSAATAKLISTDLPYIGGLLLKNKNFSWADFVRNYVYKQPILGSDGLGTIKLDSPRLPWAATKDLVYALAAAAAPAVINDMGLLKLNTKIFASIQPDRPARGRWWTDYQTAAKKNLAAVPLSVKSDYNPTSKTVGGTAEFPFGPATIEYKNNAWIGRKSLSKPRNQSLSTQNLSLVDTTTISSATYGKFASPDNFRVGPANTDGFDIYNEISSFLRRIAPLGSLKNNSLSLVDEATISNQSVTQVADRSLFRGTDGGFIDNTSVIYGVRNQQTSNGTSGLLNITVMMQSSLDPVSGYATFTNAAGKTFALAGDIMCLFGLDYYGQPLVNQAVPNSKSNATFATPSPQVFNLKAWDAVTGPTWSYRADGGSFTMDLYKLNVETVNNDAMGIKAGQKGTLNILATNNSQSAAGPIAPGTLDEYDQNFTYARDAMINKGGWAALKDVLTS